jgi:hypothetical protein
VATAPGDPVLAAIDGDRPVDAIVELAGLQQGKPPEQARAEAVHVVNGIAGMLRGEKEAAWAEPYLNDVARLAWAREERANGRTADPRSAPDSYIESWKNAFYGSDHRVPLVKELDQQMIDAGAARTAPGKPFDWREAFPFDPNGESGLIQRQTASNDCGPNAFATILRARGYNANPADAFTFAVDHKYHTGRGPAGEFTGPANFARMLREEAGLDAQAGKIDWDVIDRELAEGRPVVLSSRTHYYVLAAKDERGRYYAGETGRVTGNGAWVARNGMVYAGASPDTMIVVRGPVDPNSRAVRQMRLAPPPAGGGQQGPREALSPSRYATPAQRAQERIEGEMRRPPQPEAAPADAEYDIPEENLWAGEQPQRHARMQRFQARPIEERRAIFEDAMTRGLEEEGITGAEADRWKHAMRAVVTGDGLNRGVPGENPDLNPLMIAGESGGRRGTANRLNSSALGYFQFLRQNPNGSTYSHVQYAPDEYKARPYHPVGQVRQFVRAIRASQKYRGDPFGVVRDKNATGVWGP